MNPALILASSSAIRATLLRNAGVEVRAIAAKIDEKSILAAMVAEKAPPRDIADYLAEMKARRIASQYPDHLVLGCDQVLVQDGQMYEKPADLDEARTHLTTLRGKTHELLSAAVIFAGGHPVWRHISRAQLEMRQFSDVFLEEYLKLCGGDILSSPGCYQLENQGAQLFSRVNGDYFSVLGLPLLPVLTFLRTRGACLT